MGGRRMTREEAFKTLKENLCGWCAYGSQNMESCDIRGCDNRDAIKALEQEDILDKIRAEIEQMPSELTSDGRRMIRRESVFRIIDKYRADRSDKE